MLLGSWRDSWVLQRNRAQAAPCAEASWGTFPPAQCLRSRAQSPAVRLEPRVSRHCRRYCTASGCHLVPALGQGRQTWKPTWEHQAPGI